MRAPRRISAVVLALAAASCGGQHPVGTRAPSGTSVPHRDPRQRYSISTTVLENRDHGPELCPGLILQSLPPICSGPIVVGWDWTKVNGARAVGDVRWGQFHLVGMWDGSRFTPTEPPGPSLPLGSPGGQQRIPMPNFKTQCAPPPGGWAITNPTRLANADSQAMSAAAHRAPDFAGMWVDETSAAPGTRTSATEQVFNIAFTGDVDRHRAELQTLWGGPICVLQRPHTDADLRRIAEALDRGVDRGEDLWVVSAWPLDVESIVWATVMVADPLAQSTVDRRFGSGVVSLTGALQPVP